MRRICIKVEKSEQGNGSTQKKSRQIGQRYIHYGQNLYKVENICKDYWLEMVFNFMCDLCPWNQIRNWSEVYQN